MPDGTVPVALAELAVLVDVDDGVMLRADCGSIGDRVRVETGQRVNMQAGGERDVLFAETLKQITRITGRMRTMRDDVERFDAEREVDGVDVAERSRQRLDVRAQKRERERRDWQTEA